MPSKVTAPWAMAALTLLVALHAPGAFGATSLAETPVFDACQDAAMEIRADSYEVTSGVVETLQQSTAIRARSVSVSGTLTTKDAESGENAPGLCIEAETVSISGALCTGSGSDGAPDAAIHAVGTYGSAGGSLIISLVDDSSTPETPSLTVDPLAILCTGDGGTGGSALAISSSPFSVEADPIDCAADLLFSELPELPESCAEQIQEICDAVESLFLPGQETMMAQGGDGGPAGALTIFANAGALDIADHTVLLGAGGNGGDALSFPAGTDSVAIGGAGGNSAAFLDDGVWPLGLAGAIGASTGGNGGRAAANIDGLDCLFSLVIGTPGESDEKQGLTRVGSKGRDGDDVEYGVQYTPISTVTCDVVRQATDGDDGGNGETTGAEAQGGQGGNALLKGGIGGQAHATAAPGGPGGTGGKGGDGSYGFIICEEEPCGTGGNGGAGSNSGTATSTGGDGGEGKYGIGGDGGGGIAERSAGGKGGDGGPGGNYRGPGGPCDGGCGGNGGQTQDASGNGGGAGPGLILDGQPGEGQETGPLTGTNAPDGVNARLGDCVVG